jgi:RNA polymerase primary sigma factor
VVLSELSAREREVVKLRFGIGGCDYHTLEEIGIKFDVTRERSRQILKRALTKIKKSKHMTQLEDFRNIN